ncbi:DUF2076 domain-containing protein [Methylocapsa acidiphila]|uniref:DUF2076 domain-containing protein n=1 Tax=Methylocapsa acidiphila TaxID=133552 RepID=UPI0003F619D3|nr:DUF2076 domain-containing protein [Methylocapsa acidiphila]
MSPEERQLLTGLFDRVQSQANSPRDKEAEAFIADAVRSLPFAPYLLAQTVIVQDQALQAANTRLQELESRVQELEQQTSRGSGGFLSGIGSLFGGGAPRGPAAPPQDGGWRQSPPPSGWQQPPQQGYGQPYPPQQQGPWGGQAPGQAFGQPPAQGGGFLKGALGAAAGVAGGVLLADSIRGLFAGHNNSLGIGSGFGGGGLGGGLGGETIVNNYYGSDEPGRSQQDAYQDADQDQDDFQDASDYNSDVGYDDGSTDV